MIYVLVGENSLAREQKIRELAGEINAEKFDGEALNENELVSIVAGQTLFATRRCIVVSELSRNKSLWANFDKWLERLDDDTILILSDMALDKRTKTYKLLQKKAQIISCDFWRSNQTAAAKTWLQAALKSAKIDLDTELQDELIRRSTRPSSIDERQQIIDQLRMFSAVRQLQHFDAAITRAELDTILEVGLSDNVFGLLDAALMGDSAKVHQMCQRLAAYEDGFKVFGLVVSQVINLFALVAGKPKSSEQVASELGLNSYAVRAMASAAAKMDYVHASRIVEITRDADLRIKRGREPWSIIESMLQKIALS